MLRRILILISISSLLWLNSCQVRSTSQGIQANLVSANPPDLQGFVHASRSRGLAFPDDHGPHPEYQTEWWYYTGNLSTEDGHRFGYQLTFFRRSIIPPAHIPQRISNWGTGQAYMAHFALTDLGGKRHYSFEKLSRGAINLAGARSVPFQVWLYSWEVIELAPNEYQLVAAQDDININLYLSDHKGIILQGDNGYSQKGPASGNASHYYSMTRLNTYGTVGISDETFTVSGSSWMDHEFSTSALGTNQVGWDWFSIQLEDNTEVMFFQLRQADSEIDPYSNGTVIDANGGTRHLESRSFDIIVQDTWRSPHSDAEYPSSWIVLIPSEDLRIEIYPIIPDQELNNSYTYWEGAVNVIVERNGAMLEGYGYVEMTGYAGSFSGEF